MLGKATLPELIGQGHDVTAAYRTASEAQWLDEIGARSKMVDLFDPSEIEAAMGGTDVVIHMATSIPPNSKLAKRSAWDMNDRLRDRATGLLVDAAIRQEVHRFVQQSVTLVYDDRGDAWISENSPIRPSWDAIDSALAAERHVQRFRTHGGVGVVLRLARLYGPGKASGEYIESVSSRGIPIVGPGDNFVSSIHVGDAASAITHSLFVPDGTYNIGDNEPMGSGENLMALVAALDAPQPRRIPKWVAKLAMRKAASLLTISHRVSNQRFKDSSPWTPQFPNAAEGWHDIVKERARR